MYANQDVAATLSLYKAIKHKLEKKAFAPYREREVNTVSDDNKILYIFQIEDKQTLHFQVDINRKYTAKDVPEEHHFWTELSYNQCKNCVLCLQEYRYCPVATDLQEIIEGFSSLFSYSTTSVIVITPEREYRKTCNIQTGLQSLVGLVMATSTCPILSKLKPLAKFHLPFATPEDTLFRTVGSYLIQQYFIHSEGGHPDMELKDLKAFYQDLEKLNTSFGNRIRSASEKDASLSALVKLGFFSLMVCASLEKQLDDLKTAFHGKIF